MREQEDHKDGGGHAASCTGKDRKGGGWPPFAVCDGSAVEKEIGAGVGKVFKRPFEDGEGFLRVL